MSPHDTPYAPLSMHSWRWRCICANSSSFGARASKPMTAMRSAPCAARDGVHEDAVLLEVIEVLAERPPVPLKVARFDEGGVRLMSGAVAGLIGAGA